MMVRSASRDLYLVLNIHLNRRNVPSVEKVRFELQIRYGILVYCCSPVGLRGLQIAIYQTLSRPNTCVLDLVQLFYLYGHSVRPVMMVVYMEHTSNHLGNNLAKEFLGPHSPTPSCQGKRTVFVAIRMCVMTFLPRLNRTEIIQSVTFLTGKY